VVVTHVDEAVLQGRRASLTDDQHTVLDARVEIWPALRAAFIEPTELPEAMHVDTSQPLDAVLDQVLTKIDRLRV
jgi:hypothetical protein